MHKHSIVIRYEAWTVPPLRERDRFLMDDFRDYGIPKNQLDKLNACRMHLQVTTLAEITDHTGTLLLPQALVSSSTTSPKGLSNISHSTLQWPTVNLPYSACWKLWSRTVRTLYTGSDNGMKLRTPLGKWNPQYEQHRFWHWRMADPEHIVFCLSSTAPTRIAIPVIQRRNYTKFSPTVPTTRPFEGPPITPIDPTTGQVALPVVQVDTTLNVASTPHCFRTIQEQFRNQLRTWQRPLFGSLRKSKSPNALYQQLSQQNSVMLVSDASVQKLGQSGFAWIVAHDANHLWRGQGLAPGPVEDMHSGRAEAFGILAALIFLQHYMSCYPPVPDTTTLTCYCDNLGVITNVNSYRDDVISRPNETTNDDRDLIIAISELADRCQPMELQFMYVKGHQDTKADRPLTIPEIHNVTCDKLAKDYVKSTTYLSTSLATPEFEAAQPHLQIAGKNICRQVIAALREQTASPEYDQYLCDKFNWTKEEVNQIHWETLKYAIRNTPHNDQRRIILFINGKLPLRASKAHPHPGSQLCPSCQRVAEDNAHFLECDNVHRRRLFEKLHHDITALATKYTLHPALTTAIWLGLLTVRTRTPYPNIISEVPTKIAKAITSQTKIGWTQIYYGRLSKDWITAIDDLHPALALSGQKIATILTQTIWQHILATWILRNQHLHDNQGQLSLPDYRQAVQTMYETRNQLPPATQQAIFSRPIEQLLDQTPAYLRNWITRSTKYIKQQMRAAKKRAKLQTPDIRTFFRPRTPIANDLHPP